MFGARFVACVAIGVVAQDAAEPDRVLAELVRRADDLKAFVADYRVHDGSEEPGGHLRLAYRAPDSARVSIENEGGPIEALVSEGIWAMRTTNTDGKSTFAQADVGTSSRARRNSLMSVVRAEFPQIAEDAIPAIGAYPRFEFDVLSPSDSKSKVMEFRLRCAQTPTTFFGWLENLQHRTGLRADGDGQLVLDAGGDRRLVLSTKTGFIASIEGPAPDGRKRLELESLDLEPRFDASEFVPPQRQPDDQDDSEQLERSSIRMTTMLLRWNLLRALDGAIVDGEVEFDLEARDRMKAVLTTLHADGLADEFESWMAGARKRTTEFGEWLRESVHAAAEGGGSAVEQLEETSKEWKEKFAGTIQSIHDEYASSLPPELPSLRTGALRDGFSDVEKAAVDKAVERAMREPLLREFDETVERALKDE